MCVNGDLRKNHRQKLGLVCKMRERNLQSKLSTPKIRLTNETNTVKLKNLISEAAR